MRKEKEEIGIRKNQIKLIGMLAALFVCLCSASLVSQAAVKVGNGVMGLDERGDTYKKADVTGDGKADKIVYSSKNAYESNAVVKLKVNGKTVKTWKGVTPAIRIVTLKNKKSFLEISSGEGKDQVCGLYQVKKNKLKCVQNYGKLINRKLCGDLASIWAEKVSGNTVVLNMWLNTRSLGLVSLQNIKLNYKNGKFSLSSAMGEASVEIYTDDMEDVNYFTAKQKLTVYKKAGSSSKAFTIEKKTTFTISGVVIKNKNIYIKIKVKNQKGKTGWLKLSASSKAFVTNLGTVVAP